MLNTIHHPIQRPILSARPSKRSYRLLATPGSILPLIVLVSNIVFSRQSLVVVAAESGASSPDGQYYSPSIVERARLLESFHLATSDLQVLPLCLTKEAVGRLTRPQQALAKRIQKFVESRAGQAKVSKFERQLNKIGAYNAAYEEYVNKFKKYTRKLSNFHRRVARLRKRVTRRTYRNGGRFSADATPQLTFTSSNWTSFKPLDEIYMWHEHQCSQIIGKPIQLIFKQNRRPIMKAMYAEGKISKSRFDKIYEVVQEMWNQSQELKKLITHPGWLRADDPQDWRYRVDTEVRGGKNGSCPVGYEPSLRYGWCRIEWTLGRKWSFKIVNHGYRRNKKEGMEKVTYKLKENEMWAGRGFVEIHMDKVMHMLRNSTFIENFFRKVSRYRSNRTRRQLVDSFAIRIAGVPSRKFDDTFGCFTIDLYGTLVDRSTEGENVCGKRWRKFNKVSNKRWRGNSKIGRFWGRSTKWLVQVFDS